MSCYYHPKVPTLTLCPDCGHEMCATCSANGVCPGCRLGRAMRIAPSQALSTKGAAHPSSAGRYTVQDQSTPGKTSKVAVTVYDSSDDDRILSAVAYPLWPVALFLVALRSKLSPFVRYHALQALIVNAIGVGAYFVYSAAA